MDHDPHFFSKDKISQRIAALAGVILPTFWGVDAKQPHPHLIAPDQDRDGIAIGNSDHLARQVIGGS